MANPKMGNYWNLFRGNVRNEGIQFLLARLAEIGVRKLPEHVLATIVSHLSHDFLTSADYQKFAAATISVAFGTLQREVEQILIEFFEELGKIHAESDNDPDKLKTRLASLGADNDEDEEEDDDMAKPKTSKTPAAPAAPPAPPELTLLQVVGALEVADQSKFWAAVNAVQATLADQAAKDAFLARIKRVTLPKEEVVAILNATPVDLQRDMLHQAVNGAFNAGGAVGGFRRVMDATTNALSSAFGGGQLDPEGLLKESNAYLDRVEAGQKRRRNIR